jgi:hypothetical protein
VWLVQQPNARASSRLLCKSVSGTFHGILEFGNHQCCAPNIFLQVSFDDDRMNNNTFYKCISVFVNFDINCDEFMKEENEKYQFINKCI